MTAPEYIQLRAFARYDGLKLFALWLISFGCYVAGLREPGLGLVAIALAVSTPFLVLRLLRHFRDEALGGIISFGRGWAYVIFLFFYASLLFAVAQYVYFAFIDKGFFMGAIGQMLTAPENAEAIRLMGMGETLDETLRMMNAMRPIDIALNVLTSNLLVGCAVGLPVAACVRRNRIEKA